MHAVAVDAAEQDKKETLKIPTLDKVTVRNVLQGDFETGSSTKKPGRLPKAACRFCRPYGLAIALENVPARLLCKV